MNKNIFAFFFVSLFSINVFSFGVTQEFAQGMYWKSFPLAFRVDNSLAPFNVDLTPIVENAFNRWESVVGQNIWELNPSSQNVIRWSKNFKAETGQDENQVWAVCIRNGRGSFYVSTTIILNAKIIQLQNLDTLYRILTHEIAHSIGVDHSSEFGAIMHANALYQNNALSYDDQEAIRYVADETERRQAINYVSPMFPNGSSYSSTPQPLNCGSVGTNNSSSGNGLFSMLISLMFGLLLTRKVGYQKT